VTAACGQLGHLYPASADDQARLVAGPGRPEFSHGVMVARCEEHKPWPVPAAYFAARRVPCEWYDGAPPPPPLEGL
jgi:hypothetical protein